MKRSYLLRRPDDEDDDYYGGGNDLVHAKPIDERHAKVLGETYKGKDFVRGSQNSQQQFYGKQTIVREDPAQPSTSTTESVSSTLRPLTHDERNKISAKIIKAELKGNKELVQKLKAKLEYGMADSNPTSSTATESDDYVLLMKMDKKSGLVVPAQKVAAPSSSHTGGVKGGGTVEQEYKRQMDVKEMVANEKSTTAIDQLTMFGRAAKMCSENNTDDDWVVDDNIMSHPKKKRHEEKDQRKSNSRRIQEHKELERTLDSCNLCIESKMLAKHSVVATGLKTYLAVVPWEGVGDEHCYIAPMGHYASSLLLDEDVYEEMKLWYKGLVAMWRADDEEEQDCVFVENGKYADEQRHMTIECIPMPKETGDLAPIYFKKAIMDSEKEWSDNKKLIELSKPQYAGNIRKAVPKGFPYFAINFGLQPGYVHVIENKALFPDTFAQEIVAGMLNLPHKHWRKVKPMSFSEIKEKRDKLRAKWEPFDWTKIVKDAIGRGEAKTSGGGSPQNQKEEE